MPHESTILLRADRRRRHLLRCLAAIRHCRARQHDPARELRYEPDGQAMDWHRVGRESEPARAGGTDHRANQSGHHGRAQGDAGRSGASCNA